MEPTEEARGQPAFRRSSPSPSRSPGPAIRPYSELYRSASTGSTTSLFSVATATALRDSLENSSTGSSASRSSSGTYTPRNSFILTDKPKKRGYVRPQGTDFAASALSRESVLSLGSIAHLQYYFARTGLLDGKGGRLMMKRKNEPLSGTLDLTALDTGLLSPKFGSSDADSSYASMRSSPELVAQRIAGGDLVESPTQDDDYYSDEDEEEFPHMLPPTVSTYNHREIPTIHPPTLEELKSELRKALADADMVLKGKSKVVNSPSRRPPQISISNSDGKSNGGASPTSGDDLPEGWYHIQGMNILDIMTLAIRAAKMYYTAHDQPARLSSIKSERKIRAELLSVMDVLKRMATRNFASGMKPEEQEIMENWVKGVYDMLSEEERIEEEERKQRSSWIWLDNRWTGTEIEREYAFIKSLDPDSDTLPLFTPLDEADEVPTPFLADLMKGVRLVRLHNSVVRKSKRPFGAIGPFHTDTAKPYRCADNLRYWIKAAELRWEIMLKVDVMAVVNGTDRAAWKGFEEAIWLWCKKVRTEIAGEIKV
ncbi:hypothetical protein B7463_g1112, partial [Scytalidium lignicola]